MGTPEDRAEPLERLDLQDWSSACAPADRERALAALEGGKIVFLPSLIFELSSDESRFLDPNCSDGRAKNISFDEHSNKLGGTNASGRDHDGLIDLLSRFCKQSRALIANLFPDYVARLETGRTSFRPVAVDERSMSYRKDDRRLHVDAFPSQPLQGRRILRVFSNVNAEGAPRVWRVGEPFADYARRFLPQRTYSAPAPILELLGITKGRRTAYDQIMLSLHDRAKADSAYQRDGIRAEIPFPAGTSWIVFTDLVPHSVIAGQHALEQTFYLPVESMRKPELTPLKILEGLTHRPLAP
jgi:3-deoxy-D-manno-oct-2-ulosonic acid (Kdo) hydroxylase